MSKVGVFGRMVGYSKHIRAKTAQPTLPVPVSAINQNRHTISDLMVPTQENSREFLEKVIDAEIKALEDSFRPDIKSLEVLKHRRNALQPVSSLPPEIFAAIFSSLCIPGIPSLGGKPSQNRVRLRISHVCHQWREIALNQFQLWSHINSNTVTLAGATEILARAKSVPLYMETSVFGEYDDRFGQFLNQVQEHLLHVRHLSISANFFRPIRIYRGLITTLVLPAPTLEYLSLSFPEDKFTPDTQVLDTLFGGSTPRLSYLKLRNCNIKWDSPPLKGLKYLEIVTQHPMERPTLAVWLETLDEIPQLKTLILHWTFPVFPSNVKRTVTLPSPIHLDISASLRDCALASAHLTLPAFTSLCLTSVPVDRHTNGGGVHDCLMSVMRHIHGPQDIRPLQSALIYDFGNHLQLLAWPVPDIDTLIHDLGSRSTCLPRCDTPNAREALLSLAGHGQWLPRDLRNDDGVPSLG